MPINCCRSEKALSQDYIVTKVVEVHFSYFSPSPIYTRIYSTEMLDQSLSAQQSSLTSEQDTNLLSQVRERCAGPSLVPHLDN